jgi:hypothetical protein
MGNSTVLPYCIERKTMADLVGRSAKVAHLMQMRRLEESGLRHTFLLLEQEQNTASCWTAYGADKAIARGGEEGVVRCLADVHGLVADTILDAVAAETEKAEEAGSVDGRGGGRSNGSEGEGRPPRILETVGIEGTLRLLTAMSVIVARREAAGHPDHRARGSTEAKRSSGAHVANETKEDQGTHAETTLDAFSKVCRSQMRRLAKEPLHVHSQLHDDIRFPDEDVDGDGGGGGGGGGGKGKGKGGGGELPLLPAQKMGGRGVSTDEMGLTAYNPGAHVVLVHVNGSALIEALLQLYVFTETVWVLHACRLFLCCTCRILCVHVFMHVCVSCAYVLVVIFGVLYSRTFQTLASYFISHLSP